MCTLSPGIGSGDKYRTTLVFQTWCRGRDFELSAAVSCMLGSVVTTQAGSTFRSKGIVMNTSCVITIDPL